VSPDGVVQRANPAFLSILQRQPEQVANRPIKEFSPDPSLLDALLKRLSSRETVHNFSTEFQTAKGETRCALLDADGFWEAGRLVRSRWFVRDISRRRQLERELLENTDTERRAFAQELHDGLGQQLGGIAYLVNVLCGNLQERGARETAAARRIFELVRKAIEDTRRMARGLSPIHEEPDGLIIALRELAAQTSELKGIGCRVLRPKPVLIPDTVLASHLYRIAQEAVNNAVKHAQPRAVTISLRQGKDRLILTIADNGKGIGPLSPNRKGLGLRIMQHRANLIHGTMEVAARRPRGTQIVCTVPLPTGANVSRR
jgi:PAS domain S-box-containing protein